jgi:DNA polymerase-3 subunit beta
MKFSVSRDALHEALALTNRAASGGFDVIEVAATSNGVVTLCGSSGNVTLSYDVTAKVTTAGTVMVPGKFMQQVVSSVPSSEVSVELTGGALSIAGGPSAFSVRVLSQAVIAKVSSPDTDPVSVGGDLMSALSQVGIAASKSSSASPATTGVLLTAANGVVECAATDSYRVAVRSLEASALPVDAKALIPANVVELLNRLMAKRDGVTVRFGPISASFESAGVVLATRLIDSAFPAYQKVIPAREGTIASVSRDVLVDSLQRARLVNDSRVAIQLTSEGITLSSSSTENDCYTENTACAVTGEEVSFVVNPGYILDGLRAASSTMVDIVCGASTKPVLIQGEADDSYRYVVMPVRM